MTKTTFNPRELRTIFSGCPSGVAAVCAVVNDEPHGMAVSTFVPVSIEPALVGVFIQNSSRTWPILEQAKTLGLSVLGSDNESAATSLAMKEGDRFESVATTTTDTGAVLVEGATTWMEGAVWSKTPAGDHFMVLLEVHSARIHDEVGPLIFHSSAFHRLSI